MSSDYPYEQVLAWKGTQMDTTPGPWTVRLNKANWRCFDIIAKQECITTEACIAQTGLWADEYKKEMQANAFAMAAAPELLEACQYMLSDEVTGGSIHWNGNTHKALAMMEHAVAKAKGELIDE